MPTTDIDSVFESCIYFSFMQFVHALFSLSSISFWCLNVKRNGLTQFWRFFVNAMHRTDTKILNLVFEFINAIAIAIALAMYRHEAWSMDYVWELARRHLCVMFKAISVCEVDNFPTLFQFVERHLRCTSERETTTC